MKKIDILIGDNPYASVPHFSRALSRGLRSLGVKTRLFYIGKGRFYKALYPILQDPPDLTLSFSDIRVEGQPLGAVWNIPHLSYLVDPAIYYLHQLKGRNSIVSCVDRKDATFAQTLGATHSFFLPHGVDKALFAKDPPTHYPFDIIMMGSCFDIEKIRNAWKSKFNKKTRESLEEAALNVLTSKTTLLEALFEVGIHNDLPLLHHELDLYIGTKERMDLLHSLRGLKVHIMGRGPWKKYFPDAHILPSRSFGGALKILHQSRIVLNTSARFKEGAHERILYALALHSLPLTAQNPFLAQTFSSSSLTTYPYGQYDSLSTRIRHLLTHEQERRAIVEAGREVTLRYHTWHNRAEELLEHVGR